MKTLQLEVDSSGYTIEVVRDSQSARLDGAASRFGNSVQNGVVIATIQFILTEAEYTYLRQFYRYAVTHTSEPFLLDLIIGEPHLTEHECFFVPGSLQLVAQEGLAYTVTTQLEAKPKYYDPLVDEALIDFIGEIGFDVLALSETYYVDEFHRLVNFLLAFDLANAIAILDA